MAFLLLKLMGIFISVDFLPGLILLSAGILVVVLVVGYYCNYYMEAELQLRRFISLLWLFVTSMYFLLYGGSLFFLFMGWDGLGIISFLLVIFYVNWGSSVGSLVTLLSNRFGDCLFMICLLSSLFIESITPLISFMFMFMFFTKSAQLPFSAWLPLAMAAPTPISSLVHSSTLVIGGLIILVKFVEFISTECLSLILLISFLTLIFSGLSALVEGDAKKVVAFSTLSQISLIFMMVVCVSKALSIFHIMTHAIFKSLLFMCVGICMHNMFSLQDWRFYSTTAFNWLMLMSVFFSLFSLIGMMTSLGSLSKDFLLEVVPTSIIFPLSLLAIFLSMLFTFLYTLVLFKCLIMNKFSSPNLISHLGLLFFIPSVLFLFFGSFIFGENLMLPVSSFLTYKIIILLFMLIFFWGTNNSSLLLLKLVFFFTTLVVTTLRSLEVFVLYIFEARVMDPSYIFSYFYTLLQPSSGLGQSVLFILFLFLVIFL